MDIPAVETAGFKMIDVSRSETFRVFSFPECRRFKMIDLSRSAVSNILLEQIIKANSCRKWTCAVLAQVEYDLKSATFYYFFAITVIKKTGNIDGDLKSPHQYYPSYNLCL